ncbi:MAG: sulfurtransferase TusA family protein, partial [Rhodospirillales bacterium]
MSHRIAEEQLLADHVLDARGLQCPLPVLRANKMLKSLPAG